MTTKICNLCKEIKELANFGVELRVKSGRCARCKDCENARKIEYSESNIEKRRAAVQKYDKTHKQQHRISQAKWLSNNPGYLQAWRKANHDKTIQYVQTRRALQKVAFTENVINSVVFERDAWICQLCFQKVDENLQYPHPFSKSLDHIKPLSRGGEHSYENTQLVHLTCNVRKWAN